MRGWRFITVLGGRLAVLAWLATLALPATAESDDATGEQHVARGPLTLAELEEQILSAADDEERSRQLDRYLAMAIEEQHFHEFYESFAEFITALSVGEGDRVSYVMAVAQQRYGDHAGARHTLESRILNGGTAESHWGYMLRYRRALSYYNADEYEIAAQGLEALYELGDSNMPPGQPGRLRRQLTDVYRQLSLWEDAIRLGEEARSYTSSDDKKILGLLHHLGTAYEGIGDYERAASTVSELVALLDHFYPDAQSRLSGPALAFAGVENWLSELQHAAELVQSASNGPVRAAFRDAVEQYLEGNPPDSVSGVAERAEPVSVAPVPPAVNGVELAAPRDALSERNEAQEQEPDPIDRSGAGLVRIVLTFGALVAIGLGILCIAKRPGRKSDA